MKSAIFLSLVVSLFFSMSFACSGSSGEGGSGGNGSGEGGSGEGGSGEGSSNGESSSIYSWSIGHILEHEFFCLGGLAA